MTEAEHGALSSSKRRLGILGPIIQQADRFLPISVADDLHRGAIRAWLVRRNDNWTAVALHRFCKKLHSRFAVSALSNINFQHLTFVIHCPPEVVRLTVDLHKHLVQMPLPVRIGAHPINSVSSDLSQEHRAKSVPPEPNCFVAYVGAEDLLRCGVRVETERTASQPSG